MVETPAARFGYSNYCSFFVAALGYRNRAWKPVRGMDHVLYGFSYARPAARFENVDLHFLTQGSASIEKTPLPPL